MGRLTSLGSNVHQSIEELRYISLYICFLLYKNSVNYRLDLHYLHLDEAQQLVDIVLNDAKVGNWVTEEIEVRGQRDHDRDNHWEGQT